MPFAFVAAMGGVGFEDVAVAGFQLFDYTGLIDRSGTDIVSQRTEEQGIFAILGVESAELGEVLTEQSVSLCFGELTASAVGFARLDLVTIANVWPMLRLMERLKLFDYQDCPFKERQLHYTSVLSLLRSESASR